MADDPKISVFQLGAGGVQLVKSPLEMADTELVSAQNAEPYATRGRFGLRKRLGLTRVVPTGTVTPGSAGGAILGGFVIDDSLGYPPLPGGEQVQFSFDAYSLDGGATWVAYTPTETFPAANGVYDINGTGYNSIMTPLLPAVWLGGQYYFGGHISGQVLVAGVTKAALGAAPPKQLVIAEAVRVGGSGSVDDTVVLPNTYMGTAFDPSLIISTVVPGGSGIPQLYLYEPLSGTVQQLPQIATSSTVTGAAELNGLLWVVAGLSLYSINPQDPSVTTWTTACTISTSGIGSLAGLTQFRGSLCSGTVTNTTAGPVRLYAFSVLPDGTATAASIASANQSAAPSVILGPYPPLPTDTRISMIYKGIAPAFTTLTGSSGNAESIAGTSTRILTHDGTVAHNGTDTNTNDLVTTYFAGKTPSLGPINSVAGRIQFFYSGFTDSVAKIGALQRRSSDNSPVWSASTPGGVVSTIINASQTTYPQMIF